MMNENKQLCPVCDAVCHNHQKVIYAFIEPDKLKEALRTGQDLEIKVGETKQGLSDGLPLEECAWLRINQEITAAVKFRPVLLGVWLVDTRKIPQDKTLHKVWTLEGRLINKEWFRFEKTIEKSITHIKKTIEKFGQPAGRELELRFHQDRCLKETLKIFDKTQGNLVYISALLCPRFGKTIWALELFKRLNKKIMVLPSAWLSSHTSFEDDCKSFRDFKDFVFINGYDKNAFNLLEESMKQKKKVVFALSLFTTSKKRFKYIRDIPNDDKFICVDEADHGAWSPNKREVKDYLMNEKRGTGKMLIVDMSGTNILRMLTNAKQNHGTTLCTYGQLEKDESNIVKRVGVKLRLDGMDKYIQENTLDDIFKWAKVWENPLKNKNFLINFLQGTFSETENKSYKNLSLDVMMEETLKCAMMFTSCNIKEMDDFKKIAEEALPNHRIEVLNSDETSNRETQNKIKQSINEAKRDKQKGLLIITNTMGSRSFSISEVQASLICYDKGNLWTLMQKMYRCLTPEYLWNKEKKQKGYIVTYSINPNRDDRFINILTEECVRESESTGEEFDEVTKQLLNNVSILSTDEWGNKVELTHDELIGELTKSDVLEKVAYALAKPERILDDKKLFESFLKIKDVGQQKNKKQTQLPDANTFNITGGQNKGTSKRKSDLKIILDKIKTIIQCATLIRASYSTKGRTFKECLKNADENRFKRNFNITPDTILSALNKNILPIQLLDTIVANTDNLIKHAKVNLLNTLDQLTDSETIGKLPEMGINKKVWGDILKKDINPNETYACMGIAIPQVIHLLQSGVPEKNITVIGTHGFSEVWKNSLINFINKNIEDINIMNEFDNIIANPPYEGGKQIHQQFFNKAVEMVKESGKVTFIQPATPYQNQKKPRQHERIMTENVIKYETNVEIVSTDIFEDVVIGTDLAITKLHKVENKNGLLKSLKYKDGTKHKNISLEDINVLGISPEEYRPIKNKYEEYVRKNGSLEHETYNKDKVFVPNICGLPKVRGNIKTNISYSNTNDFFTFIPQDNISKHQSTSIKEERDFGIKIKNDKQIKNVYTYLKTFVARFGLALIKITLTNYRNEFALIPLVDFDIEWTDEMLVKELKLTQKEFKLMVDVLGDYHKLYVG
jgi:hypothetical protein